MKKSLIALAVTGAFISTSAQADYYTYEGVTGVNANITYGGLPPVNSNVVAGQFSMSNEDGIDFYAFCVDIFNTIQPGHNYDVGSSNPFGWTDKQSSKVSYLFDNYDNVTINGVSSSLGSGVTAAHAGAFQLALWEILNEEDDSPMTGNPGSLSNDLFKASGISASVKGAAEDWVTAAWNFAGDAYESFKYDFEYADGSPFTVSVFGRVPVGQDLIIWKEKGGSGGDEIPGTEIPEPAPLALMGLGLLGLGFTTRRYRKS